MENQRGLHHVGVTVSDLDRSLTWYRIIFGLAPDVEETGSGPDLCATVQVPDVDLRYAFLNVGNTRTELLQYVSPPGKPFSSANNDVGAVHICLVVDDVNESYKRLSDQGVLFNAPPLRLEEGAMAGHTIVYLRDPDGIQLELMQEPS